MKFNKKRMIPTAPLKKRYIYNIQIDKNLFDTKDKRNIYWEISRKYASSYKVLENLGFISEKNHEEYEIINFVSLLDSRADALAKTPAYQDLTIKKDGEKFDLKINGLKTEIDKTGYHVAGELFDFFRGPGKEPDEIRIVNNYLDRENLTNITLLYSATT